MKTYICTKMIQAVPAKMVNGVIWPDGLHLPVVKDTGCQECGCSTVITDGYMYTTGADDRWPQFMEAAEFDRYCRPAISMTFGDAIEAMKNGKRVARHGWNGKNQYVELASCVSYKNNSSEIVNVDHQNIGNKALAFVGTSGVQLGWLASQADMLAEDWFVVE